MISKEPVSLVLFKAITDLTSGSPAPEAVSSEALLKDAGFNVHTTRSLAETLGAVRSSEVHGCVIEVNNDYALAIDNAIDLFSQCPVIVLLPKSLEQLGVRAVQLGASDYILRDAHTPALIGRIIFFAIQQFRLNKEIDKTRSASLELSSLKQRFLNRVGREFITPLNGMLGAIDVLLQDDLPFKFQDGLSLVQSSAQSLRHLVDDVMAISDDRATSYNRHTELFDLREEFNRLMALLKIECKNRKIELIYDFSQWPDRPIIGDLITFKQLLVLIVTQLSRVLAPASVLRVATFCSQMDAITRATFVHFAFAFTDSGESKPQLLKDQLTLKLAQNLTQHLQGKIWKDFSSRAGGVVHLVIPLFAGDEENVIPRSLPAPEKEIDDAPSIVLNILVVDDHNINRIVFEKMLTRAGHMVTLAENGIQAIACAASEDFDLIFMDIQMPEMDGIEATQIIREQESNHRAFIYAASAHINHEDRAGLLTLGMDGALVKPIDRKEVLDLLARIQGLMAHPGLRSPSKPSKNL